MTEHIENKGKTALMHACDQKGHTTDTIAELIYYGLDVNAQDDKGLTALMYAVKAKRSDAINYLLDTRRGLKTDQSIQDKEGYTALMHACKGKGEYVIDALLKNRDTHNIDFNSKLNPHAKDENGYTALMHACKNEQYDMVYEILKIIGKEIEGIRNKYKDDKENGELEVKGLIDMYVENRNSENMTALMYICENNDIKTLKKLLKFGIKK